MNDCYFSLIKGGTSNTHKDNMYHNNENQGKVVKSIMYDKRADYIYWLMTKFERLIKLNEKVKSHIGWTFALAIKRGIA